LYNLTGYVPEGIYRIPIGKGNIIKEGKDITIVSSSYMTVESLKAVRLLEKSEIEVELIDLRTIKPLDSDLIINSIKKTGYLLVVDSGWTTGGIAAEIIAQAVEKTFKDLADAPQRISLPDIPTPSSFALTKNYYPNHLTIAERVFEMLGKNKKELKTMLKEDDSDKQPHDIPDLSFRGPF
jgi:pyruvate dehydrogenase E1 component beta subunit